MANLSRVLYDNAFYDDGATVSYTGTEIDGFNHANVYDYKDFSLFQPEASAVTAIDITLTNARDIDCWCFYNTKSGGTGLYSVNLYYETSPSTFTSLDTTAAVDGSLTFRTFTSVTVAAGMRIRIEFNMGAGPHYMKQLMVGEFMEMERGQYAGVNPPRLTQGIVQSNNISENGAILGTSVKRVDVKSSIDLMYLTETWVRDTWDPFALHASKGRGFFYKWNPTEYGTESVYCVASKINPPKNITPTPLMSVSMPIICRQPDP